MSDSLFKFMPKDSYPIPSLEKGTFTVSVDPVTGTMIVTPDDQPSHSYPLIDGSGKPLSRAIFINTTRDVDQFQVGDVVYAREGLHTETFPLNEEETVTFNISMREGHLGILDIRDIARKRKVVYFFDMMPVVFTIEASNLVAKTLYHEDTDSIGPWYIIS
jgi:hypothetical protein